MPKTECWCHSGKPADTCCEPYLSGTASPETCEQLMRSRYSAFVCENEEYLKATWLPSECPSTIEFDPACKWIGLKITKTKGGQLGDEQGEVAFVARYKIGGKAHRLVEHSQFKRSEGKWSYWKAIDTD